MKRTIVTGAVLMLALAGCGSDEQSSAAPSTPSTSTTTVTVTVTVTAAPSTTAEPPPAAPAESFVPETTPADAPPPAPVQLPIDQGDGSNRPTGEQLYVETCQQFLAAIDALAVTGAPRNVTVDGISAQLQANPSWSTVPPEDQQQMLRGLDAAGLGSC
ncbi:MULTISPECIES: hypothetical protein [Nocardiaceae]|uniref:hypothetical protein n=1 Tax=Nocardiaceae TaxID=85025 RepID=UPI000A8982F4|nr:MULTISPECIES: hypothetical protein [Rhodococcus]OZD14799.1 hypothetical protein CH280_10930 [Rhodococcus sp. 06-156-4C]OZD20122.1 hypothetical protein CH248_15905 [Rhodococcus sp. 06-156-4a]OZD26139.1 hypothetical protein CH247_26685 [Rhodococcus sp. 06-156-3b]OZD38346.1 hypothetical protein CH284_10435 [Rhodococcus sp. 06-156-3]